MIEESPIDINIFWFRRDLRLEDNTGLNHALKDNTTLLPLFIFDKEILDELNDQQDARVEFIHQQVAVIHKKLKGSLLIRVGVPIQVFREIVDEFKISSVYTNHDYEPYAIRRDQEIKNFLKEKDIAFKTYKDQVIFEKDEIVSPTGNPYKVYTPYKKKWMEQFNNLQLTISPETNTSKIFNRSFKMPELKDLGFYTSGIPIPPSNFKEDIISKYSTTRDYPSMQGTSRLGVHLRFGTISIRSLVKFTTLLNITYLEELIWREFYMMILYHHPYVITKAFKPQYDKIEWRNNMQDFEAWCEGKTGYPIVDAGMRELNATGFMHNRVRMIVASFLTKHLLIDWRWGEAYFAQKLLDYELASNNGGWQWAAGTGTDAQPYFRIFNPSLQAEKFDKNEEYVKRWVPEINTSNYPPQVVLHKFARERAINVYKKALTT
ncbi:MAG: DNA photolyase family protein [Bacteroidota bacterium]|nr:DNA photolyase family protein [Bacteroidota bacterium]